MSLSSSGWPGIHYVEQASLELVEICLPGIWVGTYSLESGGEAQQGSYRYLWPMLALGAMVSSGPRLLPRAMSRSLALYQPGTDGHMWLLLQPGP